MERVITSSPKTSSSSQSPSSTSYAPLLAEWETYWNPKSGSISSSTITLVNVVCPRLVKVRVKTTSSPSKTLVLSTVFSKPKSIISTVQSLTEMVTSTLSSTQGATAVLV